MSSPKAKPTILIVDDDPGLMVLMRKALQREGFDSVAASSGREAIDWLGDHQANLMLLDFQLPDMSGKEVIDLLNEKHRLIPFIIITGKGDERLVVEMMKCGARDYLVKDQAMLNLLPSVVTQIIELIENEHKLALTEIALRQSEQKYRELVELAQEGIWAIDSQGQTTVVNPHMTHLLGHRAAEMSGRSLFDFLDPADAQKLRESFQVQCQPKRGELDLEFIRKDGSRVYTRVATAPIFDSLGQFKGAIVCVADISVQKHSEKMILAYQEQLRVLASELALAEERERRRIATEIHDRIGQALIFSKMNLDSVREMVSSHEMAQSISETCSSIDQAIQDTRSLTFDLSSPTLYEFGLEAALEELLIEHFPSKQGTHIRFIDDNRSKPLADDIRILLFQVARELLINVVKHAKAQNITLSIKRLDDTIQLLVSDDGVGFELPCQGFHFNRNGGFGLFSIQERLDLVGGRLEVQTEPDHGTCVIVKRAADLSFAGSAESFRLLTYAIKAS